MILKKNCYKLTIISFLFLFFSCTQSSVVQNVEIEDLFTIPYGTFEDSLFLISTTSTGNFTPRVVMEDGFFYISDDNAQKVMQLTSFGDLVAIYYNNQFNPIPSFIQLSDIDVAEDGFPTAAATQRATSYQFTNIGPIATDTRKYLYVADFLPEDRYEEDVESGQLLRQVVLQFSDNGTFIDYIGQQGPGGSPFPYIKNIYTTKNNELVVVCLTPNGFTVFWFSENGFLKYMIPILNSKLPKESSETFVSIDSVIPDYNEQKLYLKLDYSTMEYDQSSKVQSGINYTKTLLYPLDVQTGIYEDPLVIPAYEETVTNEFSKQTYLIPYEFFGTTNSGWFFFIIANESGYSVLMVHPNGQKILRRQLTINTEDLVYYNLSLSSNGIITGLLSSANNSRVVWWRTDSITQALLQ